MFGLKTPTNDAGRELSIQCQTQDLFWPNFFQAIENRGKWFNKSTTYVKLMVRTGIFLMRGNQRRKHFQKTRKWDYLPFSDHKLVKTFFRIDQKRQRNHNKTSPNIHWKKSETPKELQPSNIGSKDKINDEVGNTRSWNQLRSILLRVAKDFCDLQREIVQNLWTIG